VCAVPSLVAYATVTVRPVGLSRLTGKLAVVVPLLPSATPH